MEESKSETVIELDYPAVRLGRNFAGRFFDLFMFVVFGFVLMVPSLFIIQGNKTYNSWIDRQYQRIEFERHYQNITL